MRIFACAGVACDELEHSLEVFKSSTLRDFLAAFFRWQMHDRWHLLAGLGLAGITAEWRILTSTKSGGVALVSQRWPAPLANENRERPES